jgi:hypothetical protein
MHQPAKRTMPVTRLESFKKTKGNSKKHNMDTSG